MSKLPSKAENLPDDFSNYCERHGNTSRKLGYLRKVFECITRGCDIDSYL